MKSATRTLAILTLLIGLSVPAAAQFKLQIEPGVVDVPRGDMLIQNIDTIWTATGTILENASILIRDGIISAIGSDLEAPSGATVIDGRGMTAIPGLVDEHSHSGLSMAEVNEGTAPIVAEVRVLDVLDPEHFSMRHHATHATRQRQSDRRTGCCDQDPMGYGRCQTTPGARSTADPQDRAW